MPHRYFTTEIADGTAVLRGTDAHHLARVMRARMGDTVILCDGSAVEYTATITGFGDDCVEFSVEPGYPSAAEPSVEVTLLAGYPKQDKLEQIIKHGVELGAAHVVPFFSRYCVAAPKKEEQKNERYNRIALEAAKQCGRGVLPDVALPLPNFGAVCRTFDQYDLVLFCYECGGAPLRQLLAEAGYPDGFTTTFVCPTSGSGNMFPQIMNEYIQKCAEEVGIHIELDMSESERVRDVMKVGFKDEYADVGALNTSFYTMFPNVFQKFAGTGGSFNTGKYSNPEYDACIEAAYAATDEAESTRQFIEAEKIFTEELPWVIVCNDRNLRVLAPNVQNFAQSQTWYVDLTTVTVE